ncbi:GNAT family N-acetyltransferase [Nonomuraea sp. SYSU D8015]|uniref:GNAT family N-acetyltransferase n=1 Tax=Nonomuraea sp. SYSU D8015 TaxID=2593644 RepID=UPI0016608729|nr:GNAT family protein [Nonomuraea sp. SYSU D8015]
MLHPHLETVRTRLRPAAEEDVPRLYDVLLRLGLHSLPNPEAFARQHGQGVDAQFAIELKRNGEIIGFSSLQHLSPAGHIQIGIFTDPELSRLGAGAEAMMLTVNYGFAKWEQVRKVYFSTTEASLPSLGRGMSLIPREAVLPEHLFFQGKLWDVHFYAITRDAWLESGAHIVNRLVRGVEQHDPEVLRRGG